VDSTDVEKQVEPGLHEVKVRIPALWLEPGLYSVYFKVLFQGHDIKGKMVSDILHLDVGGTASGWGAVLSPRVDWTIRPSSSGLGISA
jgi:lipopolysaccharide transport system ATP-binding protein